jgi:hypothetical protein
MREQKRVMAHLERQASKRDIRSRLKDISDDESGRDFRLMKGSDGE